MSQPREQAAAAFAGSVDCGACLGHCLPGNLIADKAGWPAASIDAPTSRVFFKC